MIALDDGVAAEMAGELAGDAASAVGGEGPRLVGGEGAVVVDERGRSYLDAAAWACPLGHGDEGLVGAVERVLAERPPNVLHVGPQAHAGRLAAWLASRAGEGLEVSMFATSGAEAIEAAIKLTRGATGRPGLVAFEGARHGRTMGALSLGGAAAALGPLLPGVRVVGRDDEAALAAALRAGDVAAVFVDPLHVAAGVRPWGVERARAVRAACRRSGALLVVDETRSGDRKSVV